MLSASYITSGVARPLKLSSSEGRTRTRAEPGTVHESFPCRDVTQIVKII